MKLHSSAKSLLFAVLLSLQCNAWAASPAPVPGENGMVVTAHHLATQVGVNVLKAGGNAVDAGVAVGYALSVVYPVAGNLGGGGFMTIMLADGRKTFLDFREKAPLAATVDMYLDRNGDVVKGASTDGHLAVGVPGTVSGMQYALEKYGTLPRSKVLSPSIKLAQRGFVLGQSDINMLGMATQAFRKDEPSAAIFLNHGQPYEVGQRLVQKDLARTLQHISKQGSDGFYKGPVAKALVDSSQANGGIIALADLDQYRTRELAPIECSYRGYGIISAPPPSSGGVTMCEMLNILEAYPLAELGFHSAQAVQYQIEAMRHAYVDRNSYLGDPDFVKNPLSRLLDKKYAAQIRTKIAKDKAGVSLQIKPGVAPHEGNNTTHYSIVDKWGNAVSVTYTLNGAFGAKVTAAQTGVLLNNEMDDFTVKVGVPNSYGLVQGEANVIAPSKRPLSSMSPTIVTQDGKPVMVVGTPGGSRIITTVMLTIINVIDYGMDIQEAVDAPRFHQQWLPDTTFVERFSLSPDTRRALESWGQNFSDTGYANHVTAILIGAPKLGGKAVGNNRYYGANDPRHNTGLALGY
jgi:gamma-glutamyltranspeptidase/glutathione hydrolase